MKKLLPIVLLALAFGCRTTPPPVKRTPIPPVPETPAPAPAPVEPTPEPAPPVPSEPEPRLGPEAPLAIRVGLASDLETVTFPCCEERLAAAVETLAVPVASTLRVEPAP